MQSLRKQIWIDIDSRFIYSCEFGILFWFQVYEKITRKT